MSHPSSEYAELVKQHGLLEAKRIYQKRRLNRLLDLATSVEDLKPILRALIDAR